MAKKKRKSRRRGLNGTPAEHTEKAKKASLAAGNYLLRAQRQMAGSCEEATQTLFKGLTYAGMAQAHISEATFDADKSESIRRLKGLTDSTLGMHKDLCRAVSLEEFKASRSR